MPPGQGHASRPSSSTNRSSPVSARSGGHEDQVGETGSLTSHEGTRPAHRMSSAKWMSIVMESWPRPLPGSSIRAGIPCKSMPRWLCAPRIQACWMWIRLLRSSSVTTAQRSPPPANLMRQLRWKLGFPGSSAAVSLTSWKFLGAPVVSETARLRGYRAPPCFTHLALSYGIAWDLEQDSHLQAISSAIDLFSPRVLVVNLMQKEIPEALLRLTLQSASLARGGRFHVAVHLSWEPWGLDAWRAEFGTLADPRFL